MQFVICRVRNGRLFRISHGQGVACLFSKWIFSIWGCTPETNSRAPFHWKLEQSYVIMCQTRWYDVMHLLHSLMVYFVRQLSTSLEVVICANRDVSVHMRLLSEYVRD